MIAHFATEASAQASNDTTNAPMSVLTGVFADPHIAVFGKKYYIYPTTDGSTGWNSISFSVWSSNDLQYWTNEGEVLNVARDLSWANTKGLGSGNSFQKWQILFLFFRRWQYRGCGR